MNKQDILEQFFSGNKQIPTIPILYSKFNELIQDSHTSNKTIADLIKKDQSMVTKILALSNSALYSPRGEITNLTKAITFLGLQTLKSLILNISLVRVFTFKDSQIPEFSINTFWEHSLGAAYFAPIIAKKFKIPPKEEYYIGGLIHDIGKLLVYQFYPQEFKEIILKQIKNNLNDIEAEEDILGVNHCDIGVYFAQKWKFKEEIVEAIQDHHNLFKSQGAHVAIVRLSNLFAKAAGLCFPWDRSLFNLIGDPTWEMLSHYAGQQVDVEDMIGDIMKETDVIRDSVKELMKGDSK